MEKRLFTSESVTEGHPDKICDAISDAILDALMEKDPMSRVACETAITTGMVLVMGEITTNAYIDMQQVVRETIKEIGYNNGDYGFDAHTCAVLTAIDEQSADIALGVNKALEAKEHKMSEEELDAIGAGDQGMMFGYACDETNEFMPYPISLAHKLTRQLTQVRKDGLLNYLRPDGKSQVTVEYDEAGIPHRLDAVVLSTQHDPDVTQEQIHDDIKTASYAARYVAKNIVAAGLAKKCEIQLSYAIGVAHPTSIMVDTFGTGKISDESLVEMIRREFDLRPAGIIQMLDLRRPIYKQTAAYGHFGRNDLNLPWERLDKVEELKKYLK